MDSNTSLNSVLLPKKRYTKPKLYVYGDFRDITLGTSMMTGESGQHATHQSNSGTMYWHIDTK
jgi:hypothetical protein